MKKKIFKKLQEDERRAKLLLALVLKTKGRVTEEEITDIVNNIDINKQYKINVYNTSKDFFKNTNVEDFDIELPYISINDEKGTISIYLPEGDNYMISKRVQYILDNFDVKKSTNQ